MNFIKFILKSLGNILIKLPVQWLKWLIEVIRSIWKYFCELYRRRQRDHAEVNTIREDCGPIRHPALHRADPLIYSQKYLKSLGLAVTWNNPDIVLKRNGMVVTENDLLPDTDYTIEARIWNNSYDAPAVGVGVEFSYLSFGAGTTKNPIGNKFANVGVKGGANHPAFSEIKWRTPPVAGHYCLQVDLSWFDDINPQNNLGQNNVNVKEPQSPAIFNFQLKNDTGKPNRFRLLPDTYVLPERVDCDQRRRFKNNIEKWKHLVSTQSSENFPIPADWNIAIAPDVVSLQPAEEVNIQVSIEPPESFTGNKAFNINAHYGNNKITGGVTLIVSVPQ